MPHDPRSTFRLRSLIALFGLAIFIASWAWWESLPQTPAAVRTPRTTAPSLPGLGPVVIDPGHGGQDSGTTRGGMLEKDLTLDVARRVDRILQESGVPTLLTRSGDTYVSLAARAAAANREENALFVSIHFDEAKPNATGIETYYGARQTGFPVLASWLPFLRDAFQQPNFESQSLAGFVQEALVSHTHAGDRGTRPEQFYVITNVRHPAVLVEGGFLTNKDEVGKLANPDYRELLAAAIADGVMKYRSIMRERQRTAAVPQPGV